MLRNTSFIWTPSPPASPLQHPAGGASAERLHIPFPDRELWGIKGRPRHVIELQLRHPSPGLQGLSVWTVPRCRACSAPCPPLAGVHPPPPPACDIPSGCCSFTGPWTVTRSPLRMLRRVAAFCRPLRPVLLLVSFPRQWGPVVGALGVVLVVVGVV